MQEKQENGPGSAALVTAVHKERYELLCDGATRFGRLKQSAYYDGAQPYPTTGDHVRIDPNPDGDSFIYETLPRKSFFARLDPDKSRLRQQAVAANFDYVFILTSLNQDFNPNRIERYLALAWESGASPVVVLTKADLAPDSAAQTIAAQRVAAGCPVHAVSAMTGQGLDALRTYLAPQSIVVLLGSSGVGKSSLLNALAGGDIMAVQAIRAGDDKGRHTTTHRQLVTLPCGGMVIDTPGMRELGMWAVDAGLDDAFADVEQYLGACRFTDCKHSGEPGCAVEAAIADGLLSRQRLERYLKLRREARYVEDKAAAMRERAARFKMYEKMNRQRSKVDPKRRS